ncbi:MAG: TldD/PmbA family protein [Candidatus Latescibacteria bacterium]|nr:TldD/PmbA family protein [Candidatus Latescibacterota bacterium]
MINNLPVDLQNLRAFLPEIVAAMRPRVPYASALVTQLGGTFMAKSRSEDRINPIQPRRGIRISVWDGATFHSTATSNINDRDYLIRLAKELANSVSIKSKRVPEAGPSLDKHFESTYQIDPYQISSAERKQKLIHIFDYCTQHDKRIVETRAISQFNQEYRLFCNGERLLSSVTTRTNLYVVMIAVEAGKQVMNFKFLTGAGYEHEQVSDDELRALADQTLACLSAERITPGEYRVILTPSITGLLAHESFGHGCELDTMIRGAARAALYIGKRVGSDIVNISDFGGFPNKHGSIFFSDDGVLSTEPVVLVKDGILQPTMMTDLYSYTMMHDRLPGLKLSANGRLEAWDHPIYARMTNTYFEALPREKGGMTKDELIADMGDGVMVDRFTSGMEDPLGWGVQLQALLGHEIKKGKMTSKLYYQVGMTGYVPDVLQSIDGISPDFWIDSTGTCGKGHKEYVRAADGGPYVRCRMKLG